MSENMSFGSQAVRPKVGTSANSALIRYYLPHLKLSIALFSRKRGNERLVIINIQLNELVEKCVKQLFAPPLKVARI